MGPGGGTCFSFT